MASAQALLDLVPEHLKPLAPLESKLLEGAPIGREISDFKPGEPIDKTRIGEAHRVRSELLAWLLTAPGVNARIYYTGIHLRGAKVVGSLDLRDASIEFPLALQECLIEESMVLDRGEFKLLNFSGSQTNSISADSVRVLTGVVLNDGFKAEGEVSLIGADIGGDLLCGGGEFENPEGYAFFGDRLKTRGSVFLRGGFKAEGEVRLVGADIGGDLECDGGEFENPGRYALNADRLRTRGNVFLRAGFKAKGEVNLVGADIGGNLECIKGDFENSGRRALNADGLRTRGSVFLRDGFKAKGEVSFHGADIGGDLDCEGGEIENPGGLALNGDDLSTQGYVILRRFHAKGEVNLLGADIGSNLECDGGEFENPGGRALNGDGMKTGGNVFLRAGFKAKGEVNLVVADIGHNLECDGGEFENPGGYALSGDSLTTRGYVFLRAGFKAKGEVNLFGADIGNNLECTGGEFENPDGGAFIGEGMKVTGSFFWRDQKGKIAGSLNLINAKILSLVDDEASWPEPGYLYIDGLTYGPFVSGVPADSESRLKWLSLRNPSELSVQPFEQLISVYRQMGLLDDAREVAIARQRAIHKQRHGLSKFWSWILGATIDYGYRPQKVILLFILPILLLGFLVFGWAYSAGLLEPANSPQGSPAQQLGSSLTTPLFDPLAYSVDVFLPIVDLHQEDAWQPNTADLNGFYVQYYLYFHILAGWFFTTLAVAAVTGLVRSD